MSSQDTVVIPRSLALHLLEHLTKRLQARPRTEAAELEADHLMRLRSELAAVFTTANGNTSSTEGATA